MKQLEYRVKLIASACKASKKRDIFQKELGKEKQGIIGLVAVTY